MHFDIYARVVSYNSYIYKLNQLSLKIVKQKVNQSLIVSLGI